MEIRQTRRKCFQEFLGCEAKTEMKYFINENQIAISLEEGDFFCRLCFSGIRPYENKVKELNTDAELLNVDRPMRCGPAPCKCCCYQEATITSGSSTLGTVQEQCYYCVPEFIISDHDEKALYKLHQPTCCGGVCVNICSEGSGKGCCKVPFRIYPADQADTGDDAPFVGKILKKPKSLTAELFSDADTFELSFPTDATVDQKAIIVGTGIFLNSVFFEGDE